MLPKKPYRQDANTLIWEYLDGEISPTRVKALSDLLAERPGVREDFAESALMHGMLSAYFTGRPGDGTGQATQGQDAEQKPRRRKPNAA